MNAETLVQDTLRLESRETELQTVIAFHGVSEARDPSQFLGPIFRRAAEHAETTGRELVLDFRHLERMNSSTVVSIVRVFETARRGTLRIRVVYDRQVRWQRVCFSALIAFDTVGHRIQFSTP